MYDAVIIDDEKWIVKSLISTIEDQEYFKIIGEAYDGISGLALIEELKPDLAFVDVRIPGMGGLELIQAANSKNLQTLFIVISGHAEFAYAQKAMFHNAIGYCLKPFSKSELLEPMKKAYDIILDRDQNEAADNNISNEDFSIAPPILASNNPLVKSMLDYIYQHYNDDISIQTLADICSINSNYVSQLFHQEVGDTFISHLTNLRMQHSMNLLRTTNMPISNIATAVGYRDYFYFAKVFKKAIGVTPTQYRAKPDSYPIENTSIYKKHERNGI